MNDKRKSAPTRPDRKLANKVLVVMVYLASGALIVYGGVNVSMNVLLATRGMYEGQWASALPFVGLFGIAPVIAGILLLINHPATRNQKPMSAKSSWESDT